MQTKKSRKPVKPVTVILYIFLIALAVIYVAPLLWMLSVSLKDNAGVMAAFSIARMRWKLSEAAHTFFLIGMMVPVHCILIPLFVRFAGLGLTNSRVGLMIPYITFSLPMTIFLLTGFFKSMPGELFEAASIDGANRWKQTIHITLPALMPTMVLMTALNLGNILNAGFDQIFNLYNPIVYETADIIDTYVYRIGMVERQYSIGAAVGLLKSVISFILILSANKCAKKATGSGIF